MNGSATILRADARALPLADASVDLIVTSPPYFALRDYRDGDASLAGQIGAEATPAQYIAALVACTREWVRVLKPHGSIFVNLGDKYGRPGGGADVNPRSLVGAGKGTTQRTRTATDGGGREKCLMLLPERYRIAAVDELGLIARAVLIWDKPNGLPESVTDRVRRSHEDWVHLTKGTRYFSAVDEIREPSDPKNLRPGDIAGVVSPKDQARRSGRNGVVGHVGKPLAFHPLGKLPGSVWAIPSEPLTVPDQLGISHFAAFPTEWPRRIILGWSPSGICNACGEGRRPVTSRCLTNNRGGRQSQRLMGTPISGGEGRQTLGWERTVTITAEACGCPEPNAPTRPAVVLDPFGGTGTTALVAEALGRHGISVDRSADYCRLAQWRTSDPGQRAKARGLPKPAPVPDGQGDLFALEVS